MRKRKTVPDVRQGEITVFISLWMSVILFFFQVAWESAEWSLKKSRMQEALELAECSVLSEYHRELFEKYGLFYLDLSYGGGAEDVNYLNRRVRKLSGCKSEAGQNKKYSGPGLFKGNGRKWRSVL